MQSFVQKSSGSGPNSRKQALTRTRGSLQRGLQQQKRLVRIAVETTAWFNGEHRLIVFRKYAKRIGCYFN